MVGGAFCSSRIDNARMLEPPHRAFAFSPRAIALNMRESEVPMLFPAILKSVIRIGSLRLIDGAGRIHNYGDGSPLHCTVRLHARRLDYTLALNPELSIGEAYMSGLLTVEEGTLYDVLEIAARNFRNFEKMPWVSLLSRMMRRLKQYNPIDRARRNVAHHYDLSSQLYDMFLDGDRQYSCAYFTDPEDSLETAQENKKRHIAAKLLLDRPDLHILDIGSGWGGLRCIWPKRRTST
jgi:cyclopropane-fatty-acyl-phospholipid synthase